MPRLRLRTAALMLGLATCIWPAVSVAQSNLIPVRVSLDRKIDGTAAPFFVALDRGHYRAASLDVTIEPASGALEPITRLATGAYDIALGDINALIRYRDSNPGTPVTAVFIVYNRPPYAIIGRKSRGVTSPKSLEGKKLGAPAADIASAIWPAFARANDVDAAKVTVEAIGAPVRDPMLAAGQVDAIAGTSFLSFIDLKDRGVVTDDLNMMLMSDYGVKLYGPALLVNTTFAAKNPDAVKGFLRAFVKGLKDTIQSPATAVDTVIKRDDLAKKNVELDRVRMAIRDNIVTREVTSVGYGAIDPARFEQAIEQLSSVARLKAAPKASEIFDASFLPHAHERRVEMP
jgi:NitT/TauT family transport system substrate-binding protein